ncbi:MAG: AgmX/PglI C-terminal domain-containing protein [Myxococcota bacterium]
MAAQNRQGKVLRIGIIQDGNIVQERLIKPGESVTIGESPKNTFVFPKTHLRAGEFTLFKATNKGYQLQFTDKMVGKISAGGAVVQLKKLSEDPSTATSNGVATVPLSDQDRGKITIDSVTVLFQFVAPPPVKAVTPIQQMDFRPRLIEEDDPVFLGFLGIWSALGIVLAIWVWQTEPVAFTLDDVPQEYVKVLIREPEPLPPEVTPTEDRGKEQKREAEGKESKGAKSEKSATRTKDDIVAGSAILLKFVGTKGESKGGVVANLWSDEEQGLGDIDSALQGAAGATGDASAATRTGNAGGTGAADIGGVGEIGGGQGGSVAGPRVTVKPRVSAGTGSVDTVAGDENQVRATVGRYQGQLQYCYEKEMKVDPTLEGRIEVGWSVSGGLVSSAPYIIANTTGNQALADCVVKKIRRWEFPPDVQGGMSWPFLFKPK